MAVGPIAWEPGAARPLALVGGGASPVLGLLGQQGLVYGGIVGVVLPVLGLLGQQGLVDVGDDAAAGDRRLDEHVQLLVPPG